MLVRRTRLATAVIVAACASLLVAAPPALGDHVGDDRKEVERRRAAVERELDLTKASDARVEEEVARLSQQVAAQRTRADAARSALSAAQAAVRSNEQRREQIRGRLGSTRSALVARAVSAYMRPTGADEEAVPGGDFRERTRQMALLAVVQQDAVDLADELRAAERDLAGAVAALRTARDAAEARSRDERRALSEVEQARARQHAVETELDARIADLQAETRELEAQQAKIAEILRSEEAARAAALAARRGARPQPRTSAPPTGGPSASGFIWPLRGTITSEYGPRWGGFHSGIDIADPAGTPVAASKDGIVAFSGWMDGYGNFVLVDHGDGYVTGYAHNSRLAVAKGDAVDQGQVIAYVGSTGRSTGNHLHFEVRVGGSPRNPREYLP